MPLLGRLPITIRVPLLAAALMVVLALIASQLVLSSLARLQDDRIRELARLHVEALAVALGPHVLRDDVWETYDALVRAAGQSEGRRTLFSAVADTEGRVIAATDPMRAPVGSPIAPLAAGAVRPGALEVGRGVDRVKLGAPLYYQGRHVGDIVTELDISDLAAERRRAERLLLLGNLVAALVLAGVGYLGVRRMLRPVALIVERMQAAEGAPAPVEAGRIPRGDGEIARLMRSYNAMAEAVAARAETERRLAERERFVSLGRLASSLAHEINNPLGGLLNAADTIERYADRPEVVRRSAALLRRGLRHLRDVTKAALDLNRLDRSGKPLAPEDFDDLRLLITPEIHHRAQRLEWRVEADGVERLGIAAAPARQIALNLLLNAAQAAGQGGAVGFEAEVGPAGLRLTVSDTGPGLDAAARARLLGGGPVPPGGGVGLRMVHDLVAGLGGRIELDEADPRWSTRITVTLPGRQDQPEAGDEAAERERVRAGAG
ncbi:MAG: sensor histidine kinase [Alphaproteobacteria bacterium]|nr:MAG: sensor histidine kinase [Alphaproteobacteria bacterium]